MRISSREVTSSEAAPTQAEPAPRRRAPAAPAGRRIDAEHGSRYHRAMAGDHIDGIMQAWQRERPDLDWSHQEVYFRIARINYLAEQALDRCSRANNLDGGQYSVLAALRRAGAPYRLTPTDLSRTTFCTSGAMTKRIDRLEHAGLVVRTPDQNDRRGVLVELTPRGLDVVDATTSAAAAVTFDVMGKLSCSERETISAILRRLEHRLAGEADVPTATADSNQG